MDSESNQEVIDGNVVWDCGWPHLDYAEGGANKNKWGKNTLSGGKKEPPEAKTLRELIAAKLTKGLDAIEIDP